MAQEVFEEYSFTLTRQSLLFYQLDDPVHYCGSGIFRTGRGDTPERSLVRAVLANAFDSYIKNLPATTRRRQRLFREAEEWFFDSYDDWYFSFENVCEILAVDPDYIRRGLRQYAQKHSNNGHNCSNPYSF